MYVTRPLSHYRKHPASLFEPPPEGPNSGILVIQDEELETTTTTSTFSCFGQRRKCKDNNISTVPILHNRRLYNSYGDVGYNFNEPVMFIPVLNQPLSSNRYYAIGDLTGQAYTSSKEEDMVTYCLCSFIRQVKPRPLDPHDLYQQFNIYPRLPISSVASDGLPPYFMMGKKISGFGTEKTSTYKLGEAPGLDSALRARLPDFDFPLSRRKSKAVVVGKWYCPFMFIREGILKDQITVSKYHKQVTLKNQKTRPKYYEMTLEQRWEKIFECNNNHSEGNVVTVDAIVQKQMALIARREAARYVDEEGVKFCSFDKLGNVVSVGLSLAIVKRMRWEQERVGWTGGSEKQVRVKRTEEFGGIGEWTKFGCYILVERFVLKRLNGSLLLTYVFKHTHQIKTKWE